MGSFAATMMPSYTNGVRAAMQGRPGRGERTQMGASTIAGITARQIFDSRGRPTVEADVVLQDGSTGRASVPSGSSTGRHEAWELRDGDAAHHGGLGVLTAVGHVRGAIAARIVGMDGRDQHAVDGAMTELDGTPSLRRLGANAILAVSLATARAAAAHLRLPLYRALSRLAGDAPMVLPLPQANVLSGTAMDFQDFMVVPVGAASFSQALAIIAAVGKAAAGVVKGRGLGTPLADDGGLCPPLSAADHALDVLMAAFDAAGLRPGVDVAIAVDVAASDLRDGGQYHLRHAQRRLSGAGMAEYVADLARRYPIVSVEDAFDQDDWENWAAFTRANHHLQIIGDDLFATNVERIRDGITQGVANGAIVKLNQNGTLTGALTAIAVLRGAGYGAVVAGRSGDTEDSFIADLAVATGAGQIKIGAFRNTERLAKYNQLLRIEEETGLPFAGAAALAGTAGGRRHGRPAPDGFHSASLDINHARRDIPAIGKAADRSC